MSMDKTRPGIAFPRVTETKLAKTAKEITPGIEAGLNQLLASIEGEFRTKTLPIAANNDPIRHQAYLSYSKSVLIHTPIISNAPPIQQPIFIPNLSSTQFAGKAQTGWKIGKNRVNRVITIGSYPYAFSTKVLILEKVWAGNEFTNAAKT